MKLELDLRGRLRNFKLPASRALVPLFESIVNSLRAIDEAGDAQGSITIEVIRSGQTALDLVNQTPVLGPITGFKIIDTGIGFDNDVFGASTR